MLNYTANKNSFESKEAKRSNKNHSVLHKKGSSPFLMSK